jgi:Na+/H+ antiporter 1/DSBA-like thioredoxin domain
VAAWIAFFESGVDPVVVGLVMGLLALAYPASRRDLEQASESFQLFREQPTPELARSARESVRLALSPNDRLQQLFHPWTSYLIVPLFALADAGITISGSFLAHAYTSPVTLGIVAGYVAGKPIGPVGAAWLLTRISRGRIRSSAGWAAVTGACAIAGIGFIVSLLIASLAFHGSQLAEAKVGILSAALCASGLGCAVFRVTALLPKPLRLRALLGTAETITDLAVPVDPERDHIRGPDRAPVTQMHDPLLDHQDALAATDLIRYAAEAGLDTGRFTANLRDHTGQAKIAADFDSADLSGVSGTPTFFINGKRHHGAYDIATLSDAVRTARAQTLINSRSKLRHTS